MCFGKPRALPRHLIILPEPFYYRRRARHRLRSLLVGLTLLALTAGAVSVVAAAPQAPAPAPSTLPGWFMLAVWLASHGYLCRTRQRQ